MVKGWTNVGMQRILILVLVLALIASLSVSADVPVTGIRLSESSMVMVRGSAGQLQAILEPSDATASIQWTSSRGDVVSVSSEGTYQATLNALAPGTADITASTSDGSHSVTCRVTVVIPVTGVIIQPEQLVIIRDQSEPLDARVHPSNATNQNIRWLVSDEEILRIEEEQADQYGNRTQVTIVALEAGTATVTVETQDGRKRQQASVEVIVLVDSVHLESDTVTVEQGEEIQLHYSVQPEDATNQKVLFESTEPGIVSVTPDGIVRGFEPGEARIVIRAEEDEVINDFLVVTVVEGISAQMEAEESSESENDPDPDEDERDGAAAIDEQSSGFLGGASLPMVAAAAGSIVLLAALVTILRRRKNKGTTPPGNPEGMVELTPKPPEPPEPFMPEEKPSPSRSEPVAEAEGKPFVVLKEEPQVVINPGKATLWGVSGEFAGQGMEIMDKQLSIGRDPQLVHLVYPHYREEISRKHAVIEFDSEMKNYQIIDYSTSGTFLTDPVRRLVYGQPTPLQNGQQFYLAIPEECFEIRFEPEEKEE